MQPRVALACVLVAVSLLVTCGCARRPTLRPRYGLAPSAGTSSTAQMAVSGPSQSIPASAPIADSAPGAAGGTYVQTPQGLQFQPGTTPEDLAASESPGLGARVKRAWKFLTFNEPSESKAQGLLADGERLFAEKHYDAAARRYKRAAKLWPDSPLEEDALFRRAESLFFADRYVRSSDSYGSLLKKYENSRFLDTAVRRQFAIGRYWEQLQRSRPRSVLFPNVFDETRPMFDTMGHAIAAYDSVRLNDPTGPLADDSLMATANIHFLNDAFADADYFYDTLRKEYPKSEYQIPAHVLGYRSKVLMYQGPMYEASPLLEARELGQNMLAQFGDTLGEERERIVKTQQTLLNQLAERDWLMAEYYANTAHYGAARKYYSLVIDNHPGTPYVAMAQDRLSSVAGLPNNPAERLSWLANMFPGERAKSEARLANMRPRNQPATAVAARPDTNSTTR